MSEKCCQNAFKALIREKSSSLRLVTNQNLAQLSGSLRSGTYRATGLNYTVTKILITLQLMVLKENLHKKSLGNWDGPGND